MIRKFNIIIPSIQLSKELLFCLKKLENQSYKNFIVTVVLDKKNFLKKPKFKFRLNILVVGKQTMSFKRNYAAKKYNSEYLAFIDSDTYTHKNWLKYSIDLIKNKNFNVIGGPSLPFPNQSYSEKISHFAKRSYFLTCYLNFRKYKAEARICEWLESCNFIISKKDYFLHGGMDAKKYLGEDKDFFERANKLNPNFRTFYSPKLYIYHKERNPIKLILQRFSFGTDLINIIKFNNNYKSYQPILPLFITLIFTTILFIEISLSSKIILISIFIFLIQTLILIDVIKYLKNFKKIILTLCVINLSNLAFALGSLFALFGFNKNLIRKIYLKSRNNK